MTTEPFDIPGITRPWTADELLTSAVRTLDEVETVLTHLVDPDTQDQISTIMREHANDHSGYGGLIDWVQLTAYTIRNHLNTK